MFTLKEGVVYPTYGNVEEYLNFFEYVSYSTYGFPVIWLYYAPEYEKWSMAVRNPEGFQNPNIRENKPIEAMHKMYEFIMENINKNGK